MPALSRLATRLVSPVAKQMLLAWERLESGVAYDPTSPSTRHDPYGLYDQLRRKDPVHRMRLLKAWALTRYEDVDRLLRDHKRFTSEGRNYGYSSYLTMLDFDPPKHTRLRGLVSKAFTPRAIEKLEPRIHAVVHELLDDVAQRDRFDLIDAVAFPLPVIVIAEMLGVPPEDRDRFRGWSDDIAMSVEPLLEEANIQKVRKATGELFEYFEGQIE
ncbi:MAG: cytochrome P450, partial [Alphaproteobacteria bacterium]|nr:cytochrome P450 [Alphaproteobacteria bacterium]